VFADSIVTFARLSFLLSFTHVLPPFLVRGLPRLQFTLLTIFTTLKLVANDDSGKEFEPPDVVSVMITPAAKIRTHFSLSTHPNCRPIPHPSGLLIPTKL
jgi:hypothetical protein